MTKKSLVILLMTSLLLGGLSVLAQNAIRKQPAQKTNMIGATVTSIKGKIITVTDDKGRTRVLKVQSIAGMKVGVHALCEEDCGRKLIVAKKTVVIREIIK